MKVCLKCGAAFVSRRRSQRYCSKPCAASVSASRRTGPRNSNWRGGRTFHPLFAVWVDMVHRCTRPSHTRYADYGGRGITICDRWRDDFWAFVQDVGERPPGLSIDRIDNDQGYWPENVRWATASQQRRNQRPIRKPRQRNEKGQYV